MRSLILLLLGLGAVSSAACKSADTAAEVQSSQTLTFAITGMT